MSDPDDQIERGPNAMARKLRVNIIQFEEELASATDEKERKRLRKLLKLNRDLERWCRTRAGYVPEPGERTPSIPRRFNWT